MPRGHKSKLRAREKRRQAHGEDPDLRGSQTSAVEEEEFPPSLSPCGSASQSASAAGLPQESQRARFTSPPASASSCADSDEGAKSQDAESLSSFHTGASSEGSDHDPLYRKTGKLVRFLLDKYKTKESITEAEMLKIVNRKYKRHFSEILKRASESLELVFGLDLKQVDPSNHTYALVPKLAPSDEGNLSHGRGLPKNGILMPLLAMIFMNGNRVSEEKMWEFLEDMGLHDGRKHFLYGEPRKLVTIDLVQAKYLEYQQVPNSDPPCYEFLWGPRAHAETSKMKVLEFLAKINNTVPSTFQSRYEEALRDEEERSRVRAATRAGATAVARAHARVSSSRCSQP
ncbi:melanoma-associated antigen B17 [Carlito syrichta]|uniref:Melanoma-associated antigen B17 n=1 Tax=Carlito syrichta TaxID=1868482 RepID=A0A1U7SVD6_CARSF|nr:melanoma-associated antigen B17 [Carlito syrichta]